MLGPLSLAYTYIASQSGFKDRTALPEPRVCIGGAKIDAASPISNRAVQARALLIQQISRAQGQQISLLYNELNFAIAMLDFDSHLQIMGFATNDCSIAFQCLERHWTTPIVARYQGEARPMAASLPKVAGAIGGALLALCSAGEAYAGTQSGGYVTHIIPSTVGFFFAATSTRADALG